MTSKSEVHAYRYILDELVNKKDWKKNQIYTQQECLKIKPIAEQLGKLKPENVVKINEKTYYVIESKNERKKINQAIKEAREDYAHRINKSSTVKALFITGVAGNDKEGFISKSQFFKDNKWETITENEIEVTSLLSKNQIEEILRTNAPHIKEVEISDQEFLKVAEEINGILHENAINKDYRARFISAILIAMSDGKDIDTTQETTVLISTINTKVELILKKHKKQEFSRFIKIDRPSSPDNHAKVKNAIVKTYQELLGLNIRSAMNSGKDVLGKFYEVFLKYGNGAKEIGIVLTPRHITKFSAEAVDVQSNDLVLDPTCGTGGFLVAAFDKVKKETSKSDFDKFKNWGLFGIEQQDPVVALALVNMIFRGDGKNNIIEGDCFAKWLNTTTKDNILTAEYKSEDAEKRISPITKVLMNPPFPKKKTDYKEYLFIEQALKQMQNEGILFSVLPYACMVKGGGYLAWRNRLLKENTLLSVITFPEDLFYPVGIVSIGIFVKKGIPHPKNQKVLWIRALNDGFLKRKGKRLENSKAKNDLPKVLPMLKSFIKNQRTQIKNVPKFHKSCSIDFDNKILELVPEAYLDDVSLSINEINQNIEQLVKETVSYLITTNKGGNNDDNI